MQEINYHADNTMQTLYPLYSQVMSCEEGDCRTSSEEEGVCREKSVKKKESAEQTVKKKQKEPAGQILKKSVTSKAP